MRNLQKARLAKRRKQQGRTGKRSSKQRLGRKRGKVKTTTTMATTTTTPTEGRQRQQVVERRELLKSFLSRR